MGSRLAEIAQLPRTEHKEEPAVARARRFLAVGPSLSWTAPSGRFGGLGVWARRALQRLLRPYTVRQREWESLVVDALRGQAERIEALERTIDTELAASRGREPEETNT